MQVADFVHKRGGQREALMIAETVVMILRQYFEQNERLVQRNWAD